MKFWRIDVCKAGALIGAVACLVSAATAAQAGRGAPDAVFYNGKVITVDSAFSVRQAFAVKGDTFVAVGSDAEVRKLAGQGTRLVDLRGASVIPGLTDNHDHLFGMERLMRGVDLLGARTADEIIRRLAPAVAAATPGQT